MAITLAEAKVGMADKVDQKVVDTFRRSSLLLDNLVFDNAISPGTGGSTLTYGYIQLKTPSTAAVRQINSEYTAGEAKREALLRNDFDAFYAFRENQRNEAVNALRELKKLYEMYGHDFYIREIGDEI